VAPVLKEVPGGHSVMISAHLEVFRGLIKKLGGLSGEEVMTIDMQERSVYVVEVDKLSDNRVVDNYWVSFDQLQNRQSDNNYPCFF
jgi:bisphosphoglycerate-dependent phosphoglycerate mutase